MCKESITPPVSLSLFPASRHKSHRSQPSCLPAGHSLFFLSTPPFLASSEDMQLQASSSMELVLFREDQDDHGKHGASAAVVKRKRTKRPRHHHQPAACSSASSSESTTTEEEDMAHCLILLAQSAAPDRADSARPQAAAAPRESSPPAPAAAPAPAAVTKAERYTSRKYTEAATTADGVRAGFYVYECKTCNKCFPTFQALGGHRASHKKPRLAPSASPAGAEEDNVLNAINAVATKPPPPSTTMKTASPPPPPMTTTTTTTPPDQGPDVTTVLSLSSNNNNNGGVAMIGISMSSSSNRTTTTTTTRVHECSICGAEFASGQALGGHMRRHRPLHHAPAPAPERAVTAITAPTSKKEAAMGGINLVELDLNLPAPASDEDSALPAAPPVVLGLGPFDSGKKRLMLTAASSRGLPLLIN